MTSVRAMVLLFVIPVVILLAGLIAMAIGTRMTEVIVPGSVGIVGLAALLFMGLRSAMIREHAEREPRMRALAERLGGVVVGNFLGERQLQLPHPRGRVELDYRVYTFDGESHEPFTRVALVLPAGALPNVRRDMLTKPGAEKKLGPQTRAEVAALRAAVGDAKVRLLGRGKAPSVEAWVRGWLDEHEAGRVLEKLAPHLDALASRPWTV